MKPFHLPLNLTLLILTIVAVTFMVGTLRAFDTAQAAPVTTPIVQPTPTTVDQTAIPTVSEETVATDVPEAPIPTPGPPSADTTGIIALASLIVMIIIVGAWMGGGRPRKPKKAEK